MSSCSFRLAVLFAATVTTSAAAQTFERRAADLVGRMTLEEKVSQMMDRAPAIERLGIPEYNWWNEGLHGVARSGLATVFPQAIGFAATWNDSLVLRMATVISDEFRAKHHAYLRQGEHQRYQGLTVWSPNINLFRDPRWGRGQETYGEDPYLTGRLAVQFIRGLQGDDPRYLKAVATVKHFAVHSGPEPDRCRAPGPHHRAADRHVAHPPVRRAVPPGDVRSARAGEVGADPDHRAGRLVPSRPGAPGRAGVDGVAQERRPSAAAAPRLRHDRGHRAQRRPMAHAARQLQRHSGRSGHAAARHPRGGVAAHARPVRARLGPGGRVPRACARPGVGAVDGARAARAGRRFLRQPDAVRRAPVRAGRLDARRALGRGGAAGRDERR